MLRSYLTIFLSMTIVDVAVTCKEVDKKTFLKDKLDVHADPSQLMWVIDKNTELSRLLIQDYKVVRPNLDFYGKSASDISEEFLNIVDHYSEMKFTDNPINIFILYGFWSRTKQAWSSLLEELNLQKFPLKLAQLLPEEKDVKDMAVTIIREEQL